MDTTTGLFERNKLLALLDPKVTASFHALLEPVELPKGMVLASADALPDYCFFPQAGIASIIATSPEKRASEVGIVGRDGVVPVSALLSGERMALDVVVQVEGHGLRVRADLVRAAAADFLSVRELLNRYVQTFIVQSAFTAFANANEGIEERLGRWILMCHDRIDGDRIALTHEFLAVMLAVRRPSVTTALHILEGKRLIRSERGLIIVRDRHGLEHFVGGIYGSPEREYRQLIGEYR